MVDPSAGIGRSRRGYWLSMAALVVALPAALAAQSWEDVRAWRAQHGREPVPAAVGQAIDYAGARWTVTRLTRLAGGQGHAVVLAEFEAATADPQAAGSSPCQVLLADGDGRTWQPVLFADPVVRKTYPEAEERSLCGGPAFAAAAPGKRALMAASFTVPASARDLTLSIAMLTALPAYLSVSEPRQ